MERKFTELTVEVPDHDCDITLQFPSGKDVVVQARPSNADTNYNGSLDIILHDNTHVICWYGDDMADAPEGSRPHERLCKQLCTELP